MTAERNRQVGDESEVRVSRETQRTKDEQLPCGERGGKGLADMLKLPRWFSRSHLDLW